MKPSKDIVLVPVRRLTAHPINRLIYGAEESVVDLVESMGNSGLREPLMVTPSNVIISGHRRWLAAKKLSWKTISAIIVDGFLSEEDEIEAVLLYNQQRVKTNEQRIREGLRWAEIESARAAQRQRAGKRLPNLGENLRGGAGRTSTIVAARAGIGCGRNFEKGRKAVELIDQLVGEGRAGAADGLRLELNRSYDAGMQAVRRINKDRRHALRLLGLIGAGKAKDLPHAAQVAVQQDHRRVPRNLPTCTDRYLIYMDDLMAVVPTIKAQVSAQQGVTIITDPPYTSEPYGDGKGDGFRDAYRKLAALAAEILPTGGSLFTMAGAFHLPEILDLLRAEPRLSYYWTICLHQPGPSTKQRRRLVNTNWKPILWFVKGQPSDHRGKKINDVVRSELVRKTTHRWQQPHAGLEFLISQMTKPGGVVVDPFMGVGTTGQIALTLGRRFIGVEIQEGIFRLAAKHLAAAERKSQENPQIVHVSLPPSISDTL